MGDVDDDEEVEDSWEIDVEGRSTENVGGEELGVVLLEGSLARPWGRGSDGVETDVKAEPLGCGGARTGGIMITTGGAEGAGIRSSVDCLWRYTPSCWP